MTSNACQPYMEDRGPGAMGIGVGHGHNRAVEAAQAALQCRLLGHANIAGDNL